LTLLSPDSYNPLKFPLTSPSASFLVSTRFGEEIPAPGGPQRIEFVAGRREDRVVSQEAQALFCVDTRTGIQEFQRSLLFR
jgi:hypothetical protein